MTFYILTIERIRQPAYGVAVSKLEKIAQSRDALLNTARTLTVCVTGADGTPDMGTSPFIRDDMGCFYIYTSQLSSHVRALLSGQPAHFMVIADEAVSQNIWARVRVKFDAQVTVIDRNSQDFHDIAAQMAEPFGPTMALIKEFTDFHMIKLTPQKGVIVTGFASAYEVAGPEFTIGAQLVKS